MKILFDIIHLAHLNFFKNTIYTLKKQGHDVKISYLDRGKIEKVLTKEFPGFSFRKIGKYSNTSLGKPWMIFKRFLLFTKYLLKEKPDITTGVGDFILAFSSRLQGIPSVLFYDDYEFKINFNLSLLFANKLIVPDSIPGKSRKLVKYHGFKELAYLHPEAYGPSKEIISKISLKENDYVFAREVAGISMNYTGLKKEGLLPFIKYLHSKKIKVVLSLEDKSRRQYYEPYCTILEEPLEDIYSIMSYARFSLSSGDSMARESALLGVPCVYTGGRHMKVNEPFIAWGGIFKIEKEEEIIKKIDELLNPEAKQEWALKIKRKIKDELVNTNRVINGSLLKI
jgi:predicted glycosyltransferase